MESGESHSDNRGSVTQGFVSDCFWSRKEISSTVVKQQSGSYRKEPPQKERCAEAVLPKQEFPAVGVFLTVAQHLPVAGPHRLSRD